jgi:hypothetical protein
MIAGRAQPDEGAGETELDPLGFGLDRILDGVQVLIDPLSSADRVGPSPMVRRDSCVTRRLPGICKKIY